jgi:hypothetical protein
MDKTSDINIQITKTFAQAKSAPEGFLASVHFGG